MKKLLLISILGILIFQLTMAQSPLTFELKENKKEVLYLSLQNAKELEYIKIEDKFDNKKNVNSNDNSINIYLKWINPLKYKLWWKDSTKINETDIAVNNFVSLLVAQFGPRISRLGGMNSGEVSESKIMIQSGFDNEVDNRGEISKSKIATIPERKYIVRDFNHPNLILLLLHLEENLKDSESDEIKSINELTKKLEQLDSLNAINVSEKVIDIFSSLIAIDDINQLNTIFPIQIDRLKELEGNKNGFKRIEILEEEVSNLLKKFTISDPLLNKLSQSIVLNYLESSRKRLKLNKQMVLRLKVVIEQLEASTKNESENPNKKGYFRVHNVSFNDDSVLETAITLTEYVFDKEKIELSKKREILKKKFTFQKHEAIDIFIGTGIFYGNTTLKGYGISNSDDNFLITKEDIEQNNAIVAMFLNFDFKTSKYFSPLLQIGIDPTKKRPFMLLGGGFSIPIARLALSGGAIWTWNQTLDSLEVGQIISSTTVLEKDLKYNFEVPPKGWYIGIQYKF